MQEASIRGRVTGDDGIPLGGATVEWYRWQYLGGTRRLVARGNVRAAGDGSFLFLGLSAGRYYISASVGRTVTLGGPQEVSASSDPERAYIPTFYPNTTDAAGAVPVLSLAGAEVSGIDIRLKKEKVFRIQGSAINTLTGQAASDSILVLTDPDSPVFSMVQNTAVARSDGTFEFRDVRPGRYLIQAQPPTSARREPLLGALRVAVQDADVGGLRLELGAGSTITGAIGGPAPSRQDTPPIEVSVLQAGGVTVGSYSAAADEAGRFVIEGIPPDLYRANVDPIADGLFLESIRADGKDVTSEVIDLLATQRLNMEVRFSTGASIVNGGLKDADRNPIPSVFVTLWNKQGLIRRTVTDESGSFSFSNLAPGAYWVAAWENADPDLLRNPEFYTRFQDRAAPVSLTLGSQVTVDCPFMESDAIDREAAQVP